MQNITHSISVTTPQAPARALTQYRRISAVIQFDDGVWLYHSRRGEVELTIPPHAQAARERLEAYALASRVNISPRDGLARLPRHQYRVRNQDGVWLAAGMVGEYHFPDAPFTRCRILKFNEAGTWVHLENEAGERVWGFTEDFFPLPNTEQREVTEG